MFYGGAHKRKGEACECSRLSWIRQQLLKRCGRSHRARALNHSASDKGQHCVLQVCFLVCGYFQWSCLWGSHPLLTESEVRWLLTIITLTGGNVDVQQKPPIQVALLKEGTSIPCKVIFPYMPKYTRFSICYYRINSLDQKTSIYSRWENVAIPSGEENKTASLSYDYRIIPLENTSSTGTYYCEVKWNDIQKMGKGVFVLVRGKWTTRREG